MTASSLVVLALADPLPLRKRTLHSLDSRSSSWWDSAVGVKNSLHWRAPQLRRFRLSRSSFRELGLFYNDEGHKAYDRDDFATAERYHLKAIAVIPNHPLFLDNLGMVYLQQFTENRRSAAAGIGERNISAALSRQVRSLWIPTFTWKLFWCAR